MEELSSLECCQVNGGGALTIIIYCILGTGLYKILKAKKGRVSIAKLITYDWKK